jgi:hypothetical protein
MEIAQLRHRHCGHGLVRPFPKAPSNRSGSALAQRRPVAAARSDRGGTGVHSDQFRLGVETGVFSERQAKRAPGTRSAALRGAAAAGRPGATAPFRRALRTRGRRPRGYGRARRRPRAAATPRAGGRGRRRMPGTDLRTGDRQKTGEERRRRGREAGRDGRASERRRTRPCVRNRFSFNRETYKT